MYKVGKTIKNKTKHQNKLKQIQRYQAPMARSYGSHSVLLLHLDFLQLFLPRDDVGLFLISRDGVDAFGFPPCNSFLGLGDLSPGHLILLATLTLAGNARHFVYQLHAAGFAGSVLLVAVCSESSPFVVAANEDLLVVETHVYLSVSGLSNDTLWRNEVWGRKTGYEILRWLGVGNAQQR
jgi:hypothetical protein